MSNDKPKTYGERDPDCYGVPTPCPELVAARERIAELERLNSGLQVKLDHRTEVAVAVATASAMTATDAKTLLEGAERLLGMPELKTEAVMAAIKLAAAQERIVGLTDDVRLARKIQSDALDERDSARAELSRVIERQASDHGKAVAFDAIVDRLQPMRKGANAVMCVEETIEQRNSARADLRKMTEERDTLAARIHAANSLDWHPYSNCIDLISDVRRVLKGETPRGAFAEAEPKRPGTKLVEMEMRVRDTTSGAMPGSGYRLGATLEGRHGEVKLSLCGSAADRVERALFGTDHAKPLRVTIELAADAAAELKRAREKVKMLETLVEGTT